MRGFYFGVVFSPSSPYAKGSSKAPTKSTLMMLDFISAPPPLPYRFTLLIVSSASMRACVPLRP